MSRRARNRGDGASKTGRRSGSISNRLILTAVSIYRSMESGHLENATGRTGPLSYGQRALWFLQQLAPDNCAYNISVAARIRGALNVELLAACVKSLVDRHPSLRTVFPANKGKPIQLVRDGMDIQIVTL